MRMSGTRITVVVGALLLMGLAGTAIVAQSQKSAEELYQSALVMKEGRGDLEGAIKLFAKILADFPKERSVTGKAQLQIGLCYEKLGEAKAQDAYRKVIADFQDQPEAVKIALERLTALSIPAPAPAEKGMVLRQVDLPDGKISPDGRWIASGEYDENISLYEIATKKKTPLTHYSMEKSGYPMIGTLEWMPSGRQLAYILWDNENFDSAHIIDLTGENDKVVYQRTGAYLGLELAGRSGEEGAIFLNLTDNSGPKRLQSIGKLTIASKEFREIRKHEGDSIWDFVPSPDGRSLACSYGADRGSSRKNGIVILDIMTGAESVADEHPEQSIPAAWTPDGKGLIFTSRRSGTYGIWLLPVHEGKTAGEPLLLKEFSASVRSMGMLDRALYVHEYQFGSPDVYLAQVDLATGKTLREPEPVEKDYRGVSKAPFWSPDGRAIAYLYQSSHRPSQPGFSEAYDTLRIRDLTTNEVKDFRSPFQRISLALPRWSRDGNYIYLVGTNIGASNQARQALFRIDVKTGESKLIHENQNYNNSIFAITADGKTLYWSYSKRGETPSDRAMWLVRMDLETMQEKEIYRVDKGEMIILGALSNDDQWLGFSMMTRGRGGTKFCVLPAQGGDIRVVLEKAAEKDMNTYGFFWDPSGKGFLFRLARLVNDSPAPAEIWRVADLANPEPKPLDLKIKSLYVPPGVCFHPDGKTIAFQASGESISRNWVLENFLPPAKSGK